MNHCQSGTQVLYLSSRIVFTSIDELGTTPYHDAGLRGEGQIIGVGDTGLDYNNCYFYDSNVAAPINTINQAHR